MAVFIKPEYVPPPKPQPVTAEMDIFSAPQTTESDSYFKRMMHPRQIDFRGLFLHQRDALMAIQNNDWQVNNPVIVSLPTGTGKTSVLISAPYALESTRVLVIAPDLALFDQLKNELQGEPENPNNMILLKHKMLPLDSKPEKLPTVTSVKLTGDLNISELRTRDIVLANVDKFHTRPSSKWEELLSHDFFDLVIVDEAHHLPSDKWRTVVEYFRNAKIIFLTATPFRGDGKDIVADLTPPLCHGKSIYNLSLQEAIVRGQIKTPHFEELGQTNIGTYPDNRILAKVAEKLAQLNDGSPCRYQGMVIALDQDHAGSLCDLWKSLGTTLTAEVYHGNIRNRHDLMKKFKAGQIDVFIVVQMLKEGFDHPPVSVIGICRNIDSPLLFTQFVGRSFRIVRKDGLPDPQFQQHAYIYAPTEYRQRGNWDACINGTLIPLPS